VSFKSVVNGHVYRHIILAIRYKVLAGDLRLLVLAVLLSSRCWLVLVVCGRPSGARLGCRESQH
jgi:hypothetical protein